MSSCTLTGDCYAAPSMRDSPEGSASELSADHEGHFTGSSHSATSQAGSTHQTFSRKPGQGAVIIEHLRKVSRYPGKPQGGASDTASAHAGASAAQPGPVEQMTVEQDNTHPRTGSPGSSSSDGCLKNCLKGKCKC